MATHHSTEHLVEQAALVAFAAIGGTDWTEVGANLTAGGTFEALETPKQVTIYVDSIEPALGEPRTVCAGSLRANLRVRCDTVNDEISGAQASAVHGVCEAICIRSLGAWTAALTAAALADITFSNVSHNGKTIEYDEGYRRSEISLQIICHRGTAPA